MNKMKYRYNEWHDIIGIDIDENYVVEDYEILMNNIYKEFENDHIDNEDLHILFDDILIKYMTDYEEKDSYMVEIYKKAKKHFWYS